MCSNQKRFEDGMQFIEAINNNNTTDIRRIGVYFDEIHEYITDSLRSQIEYINNMEKVKCITALTASPDNVWQSDGFWSKLKLIKLDELSESNYVGYKDMIFNCIDDFFENPYIRPHPFNYDELDRTNIEYIKHVLHKHPEILGDDTRSFIPAHKRRSGHNSVREVVYGINPRAVVIVINGFEKTLQYHDDSGNKKTIALSAEDEEVCETISRLVLEHNLQGRPIVITGLLCVGMGQTLTHPSLGSFTSAIFGHLDLTNDEIYQLFGRITGRMKHWDKYVQTQIYCPTGIMHRCIVMEDCARNMATEYNGEVVSQEDYRGPMKRNGDVGEDAIANIRISKKTTPKKDIDKDKDFRIFELQEDAIQFAKGLGFKLRKRSTTDAPKELLINGQNPTKDILLNRMWGLSENNRVRMVPIIDDKWCVYWRPSMIGDTPAADAAEDTH
jgi:hypothetical protein